MSLISIIFISTFILVAISRTIYYHIRYGLEKKLFNPVLATALLIFLSSLLFLIHAIVTIAGVLDPSRFEVVVYPNVAGFEDVEDISVKGGKQAGYAFLVAGGTVGLASLQVFTSWQQIAVKASRFGGDKSELISRTKLISIRVFVLVSLFLILIAVVFDQLSLGSIFVGFIAICLAIGYPLVYVSLKETFKNMMVDGNQYVDKLLNLIRFCCKVNAVCLFLSGTLLLAFYPLLLYYPFLLIPGKFNFIVFIRDIITFIGLLQIGVMAWYVNSVIDQGMPTNTTGGGIWGKWDSQHSKLAVSATSKQGGTLPRK